MRTYIHRERLEAWLFAQPENRQFNYFQGTLESPVGCLLCNFLRETQAETGIAVDPKFIVEFPSLEKLEALDDWVVNLTHVTPLTAGNAQSRYIALFGDPRETEPTETPTPLEKR